jgi:DNA-binding winged helix-turn-helix (wHTH) protein/tetratricopeptide (TPR) repeat protein
MKSFDEFRLDVVNQSLWRGNDRVALMPKPFAVLQYLVERPGRLVTQDQLLKAVWPETHVQADVLRRYIMEIRRALGDRPSAPRFIQTFPKRGFQFIATVVDESDAPAVAAASGAARLVGRMSALTELERHLSDSLANKRQVVFVVGEPGIGKTRLVDTFQQQALAYQQQALAYPQMRVARGHAVEGFGSKEPYYPVLEALGQLVRSNVSAPIVETLATHAPTWMIQFRSLIREDQRAALQREILGATRERMVRELCEALELITQTDPVLLVLEDLHWADHSTLDLVSALARRRSPAKLMLVVTYRPADVIVVDSPLKALSHDLTLHRLSHEVVLERLTDGDVAEYLSLVFAPEQLPHGLATLIHRHSDGNPLFMTAILDHLEQRGVLAGGDGSRRLTVPLADIDLGVPDTLRQMLEMQLEHLSIADRRLLECASVAGQHFTAWSVAAMLVREPSAVEAKCQALADVQQFVKPSGVRTLPTGALTAEYEFKHALYREVLYRRVYPSERVNFHRRLAEGFEALRSPVEPELAAEIALHFEHARKYEQAVRYLLLAAENATRRHAYRESIGVLEHAQTVLERVEDGQKAVLESQILERLADAQYVIGDVERSLHLYDVMAARASAAGLPVAEATFVDSARCVAGCERAAAIGAEIGDRTLEAHATLLAACWRIMNTGWQPEEADACAASIATLRALDAELPPYDQILYARVKVFESEYAEATESTDRALRKLTEAHALWVRAKALSTKANALLFAGQLGEAHRTVMAGIALAKKNENAPWLGILLSTLAWLKWEAFDFAGLDTLSVKVDEFTKTATGPQLWLRATANVAGATMRNLLAFGDLNARRYERALRQFREILDQQTQSKFGLSWQRRMLARLGLTETLLAMGELARAAAEAEQLIADVTEFGDCYLRARAFELHARLAAVSGRAIQAEQRVRAALEAVTRLDVPLVAWRVHGTAWDILRGTNTAEAERQRAAAEGAIYRLANSLAEVEPLRQSFLTAPLVRRVLDGELADEVVSAVSTG